MQSNRQAYLDWLRILAILGVLFFHSAMPFVSEWDWHLKNKETSNLLMEFNFFMSRFRMPLLFFISGAVAYFMLQRRSAGQFIGLRFRRLFIPLLFGMLLIVPIQVYLERVNTGFQGNFLDFYPTLFTTGAYPQGNLSWHHLWFIAYLFVYDVLMAPLFKWFMIHRNKMVFFKWLSTGKKIYLLVLPSVICFTALVFRFPETHDLINDWCWFIYWLFFLLAGFLCICIPSLMDSLQRNRRTSFTLAVLTIITINYLRWNQLEPYDILADWRSQPASYAYISLYAFTAWFWVFTAIGYGKQYMDKPHRVQSYINSAVYPFYILHQTVIVVLAFYVIRTNETILMKYISVVMLTFLISMSIYHLFIRPFAFMRFLFGAKKDKALPGEKKEEDEVRPSGQMPPLQMGYKMNVLP